MSQMSYVLDELRSFLIDERKVVSDFAKSDYRRLETSENLIIDDLRVQGD